LKISRNSLLVFLPILILGIFLGVQFRTIQEKEASNTFNKIQEKRKQTMQRISSETKLSEQLKSEIKKIEKDNISLYAAYSRLDKNGEFRKLNNQLARSLFLAGMTDVHGKGIIVTIDDASIPLKDRENSNSNDFVIHQQDIVAIINELRKGGAEAISINGERVVSSSAQICAGPTIIINHKKYITPFEIKAIGDPQLLFDTLVNSPKYVELKEFSLPISIKTFEDIQVNRFLLNKGNGEE